jgi:hypothetical protein
VRRSLLKGLPRADVRIELSRIDITYVSFQQPMSHQGPSLYIQISIASRTANGSSPHSGVPGIFFKVDVEPVRLTLIQRTTTFAQFFIRCVTLLPFTTISPSHVSPTAVSASSVANSSAYPGASPQQTARYLSSQDQTTQAASCSPIPPGAAASAANGVAVPSVHAPATPR